MDYVSGDEYLLQDYEPSRSVGRQVCHRDLVSSQGFTPCISVIARDWVDISDSAAWTSLEIPVEAEGLSLHRSWRSPSCSGSPVRLAPSGFPHWLEWHRVVEWGAQRAHWPVSLQDKNWQHCSPLQWRWRELVTWTWDMFWKQTVVNAREHNGTRKLWGAE